MARKTSLYSTPAEIDGTLSGLASAAFVTQDLLAIKAALDGVNASADQASASLAKAFANASQSGRSFLDTLSTVATSLTKVAGAPLSAALNAGLSSVLNGFSIGGAGATVAPFADGGIVASPTFFGAGGSLGLMGERGAEAILPLARGPNGQLGIAAQGAPRPTTVNVTIAASDVESFRRSEAQIAGVVARAVQRGQRVL